MTIRRHHVRLGLVGLVLLGSISCRNNNTIVVPNRVLDRPLDVTLACVRSEDGVVEVLSLNECDGAGVGDCEDDGEAQLIGFVANSDKNEIAMFRRCDVNGVVDLDPEAPGYNLVPVGARPSRIVQTPDCRVVTANWGSCDFSAVVGPELAAYALGLTPDSAPSALVSTIRPLLSDGTPLGASPGDMIAVPSNLSLASGAEEIEADPAAGASVCDPDRPASVYVTFPTCQLVAEISLGTQRILQSRQFVVDDDGGVQIIDTGPDPDCPVECPLQFDGDIPEGRPFANDDGVFPMALALVQPDESDTAKLGDDPLDFPSLFVGGTGTDEIFEIELLRSAENDAPLGFAPVEALRRLQLEAASGISAIRPVPRLKFDNEGEHQFLYVIAGDGSTRVVDRVLDGSALGVECDTQVDPSQAVSRACHPIDPGSQTGAASRRPFAAGPGIRGSDGSTITDWTFHRIVDAPPKDEQTRSPLGRPGVVGIGTTSFGRIVLGVFSHYDGAAPTVPLSTDGRTIDPIGLLNVEIRPHMLWPVTDPESGEPSILPLVDDTEPDRVLSGEDNISQVLAPTMRRIDRAYFADGTEDFSGEQNTIWTLLGNPTNVDRLGGFDGEALYEKNVVRVGVRDYRQWRGGQTWTLEYEPQIPGTESATGRIVCDNPSPNGQGTCHTDESNPNVYLVDEGATFCDEGVLPGDKMVLFGCSDDDSCGVGRRCLRDPNVAGATSGICVSSQAYENNLEDLRAACAPFVTNPCGQPRREYTITSATQTELTFVATDIPAQTYFTSGDSCPQPLAGTDNVRPGSDGSPTTGECVVPGSVDEDMDGLPDPSDPEDPPPLRECEARLTCAGIEQPTGGCADDTECPTDELGSTYICFDGLCRTPCEGGSFNCRQTPLPGPGCFGEFVRYTATLRESFGVSVVPAAQFMTDRVITDPQTGECREDPTISSLLTSRVPVGPNDASTFAMIADCVDDDEAAPSDPNPCRIVKSRFDLGTSDPETSLYHSFAYGAAPIEAIRYSNPFGTLVIDLVSPLDLASPNELPGGVFTDCFADFRRARIPRNYRESFTTPNQTGYQAYNDPIVVGSTPLTYPVRVVAAPEVGAVFAVDAGGRGGAAGVRGQVVRIEIREGVIRGDELFRVR